MLCTPGHQALNAQVIPITAHRSYNSQAESVRFEDPFVLCAAKRSEYQAYETEVFEALAALVKDAASLRVYLAAAMRVEAETFTRATTTGTPLSDVTLVSQNGLTNSPRGHLAQSAPLVSQNGLTYGHLAESAPS